MKVILSPNFDDQSLNGIQDTEKYTEQYMLQRDPSIFDFTVTRQSHLFLYFLIGKSPNYSTWFYRIKASLLDILPSIQIQVILPHFTGTIQ